MYPDNGAGAAWIERHRSIHAAQRMPQGALLQLLGETEMRSRRGFTLIELMIVVAIIAILVAVGYPAYTDQVRKGRRADGKAMLQQVMNQQERYYTSENAYTEDLTDIDAFGSDPAPSQEGWYNVSADFCTAGDDQCVQLTATAQNDQANDQCGDFILTSRGQRNIANQATGVTADDCW